MLRCRGLFRGVGARGVSGFSTEEWAWRGRE
jgi:hypothetical protein